MMVVMPIRRLEDFIIIMNGTNRKQKQMLPRVMERRISGMLAAKNSHSRMGRPMTSTRKAWKRERVMVDSTLTKM